MSSRYDLAALGYCYEHTMRCNPAAMPWCVPKGFYAPSRQAVYWLPYKLGPAPTAERLAQVSRELSGLDFMYLRPVRVWAAIDGAIAVQDIRTLERALDMATLNPTPALVFMRKWKAAHDVLFAPDCVVDHVPCGSCDF